MSREHQVQINKDYVLAWLKRKGISCERASEDIGKNGSFLRKALARGTIAKTELMFLCTLYGMSYEKATSIETEETTNTVERRLIHFEDILHAVRDAVDDDVQLVLDDMKEIGKICDGVERAEKETRDDVRKLVKEVHEMHTFLVAEEQARKDFLQKISNNLAIMKNVMTPNNTK